MSEGSCGVSLVVTVRDEAGAIDELCASIAAQTLAPDEVVVVDGGSADDTVARLGRWRDRLPLRVLTVPGANISQGRNAGVAAARHELIAVTDAGVRLAPGWLGELVAPLRLDGGDGPLPRGGGESRPAGENAGRAAAPPGPPDPGGEGRGGSASGGWRWPAREPPAGERSGDPPPRDRGGRGGPPPPDPGAGVDVAGGFFLPDPRTPFEVAMGATVLPALADVETGGFLPSSRSVAFRRAAWARAGGYPEWLDYCEDLVFDLRLRAAGARFTFVPGAVAYFRPRGSWRGFWRQYFRYARGDGKAGLFARRHAIRYLTYAWLAWFLGWGRRWPFAWALLLVGGAAYLRRPYARLAPWLAALPARDRALALGQVPLIRLVGDLAKMAGYPVGLLWRARRYGLGRDWRTIDR